MEVLEFKLAFARLTPSHREVSPGLQFAETPLP
jgi:hypothetical protein